MHSDVLAFGISSDGRKFFDYDNKTMEQLLSDGGTAYVGTLYKFVTNIDLVTKL